MTTLGTRLALVELDEIRADLAALADRLERVTVTLGGGTIDLRDRSRTDDEESAR